MVETIGTNGLYGLLALQYFVEMQPSLAWVNQWFEFGAGLFVLSDQL